MAKGPALVSGRLLFPLCRIVNTVGRRDASSGAVPDVDLELLDREHVVSRCHAEIEHSQGELVVRDAGSTNGVIVDGKDVPAGDQRLLDDSDRVSFGGVTVTFMKMVEWPSGVTAEWLDPVVVANETAPFAETLTGQLHDALQSDGLQQYYQPKVTLANGQVDAVEALARWPHPDLGLLTPDRFIPVAEATGLVQQLSRWALNAGARQCRAWMDEGRNITVSVNLAVQDIEQPDFADMVIEITKRWRVPASMIELEITETEVMSHATQAVEGLLRLQDAGFHISIDDFGIGNSSLSYLKDLPVHELKIDKSFCQAMEDTDRTIVRSTIDLAHELGMRVVAEGVELPEAHSYLCECGCDVGQGYYYGRPSPPEKLDLPSV